MARIAIDQQHHPFYKQLTGKEGDELGVFRTMKDVFIVAFALGVSNGQPVPVQRRVELFDTNVFGSDEWSSLEAVYIGHAKDLAGLDLESSERRANEAIIGMAENFANAGIVILRDKFDPRNPEVDLAYLMLSNAAAI